MKAKEVMKILNICRTTLYKYAKNGTIKFNILDNGYYDYDEKSVYSLKKKNKNPKVNVIYSRVSTCKQKNDLITQTNNIKQYCDGKSIEIETIYSEIASGLDFDRKEFSLLLDDIFNYKIDTVYISNKDRLTRLSFNTLTNIFKKFDTKIAVVNNVNSKHNDNEIFEELISLMHIFSTTMYSNRRKNKINIWKNDIENFISPDKK
jgi:putative resolvase